MELGFTAGGLDRIVSIYEPENVASGRVMEHLGFTPASRLSVAAAKRSRSWSYPGGWEERRPMGDIAAQTAVEPVGEGRYTARCTRTGRSGGRGRLRRRDRPAGRRAESPFARPASFFCHYLSVAAFAPVDLTVTPLRAGAPCWPSA